jgi:hypothetical protein
MRAFLSWALRRWQFVEYKVAKWSGNKFETKKQTSRRIYFCVCLYTVERSPADLGLSSTSPHVEEYSAAVLMTLRPPVRYLPCPISYRCSILTNISPFLLLGQLKGEPTASATSASSLNRWQKPSLYSLRSTDCVFISPLTYRRCALYCIGLLTPVRT